MGRILGPAERAIDSLRRRLRSGEVSLLDKYAARVDAVERVRPVFVIGAGLGAALTAGSRFLEGVPGIVAATVGIAMALIFGGLVGWADFRKLEISREAREALVIAEDALDRATEDAAALDHQSRGRGLREERLKAGALMREAVGSGIAGGLMVGDALDSMLDAAKLRLVAACGFEAAEYWTVTIFTVDATGGEMTKIAALWNDATASIAPSRSWRKGEGFTGTAWRNESRLIVSDIDVPDVGDALRLPIGKQRAHDRDRYRSAVSVPVVIGGNVWGVITATSDRPGRFDREGAEGAEAVSAIQDVAEHATILAIADRITESDDEED